MPTSITKITAYAAPTLNPDPKDHKVTCSSITISANDYDKVKAVLPAKEFDNLEIKRELAVMHEVIKHPGNTMIEKVDNTIEDWSKGQVLCDRYKLKYRY
jgi:hypothetical protein